MRILAVALVLALALVVPVVAPAGGAAPPVAGAAFQAGAAKAEITPPVTTPLFAYTARHAVLATAADVSDGAFPRFLSQRLGGLDAEAYAKTFLESEGVHTRLYAQAFVLDDGRGAPVAVVLTDLGAVPGELHQGVADRLAALGVPVARERLLIGATHTHGGPGGFFQYQGYALLGGDAFDPRVFGLIADQIAKAVRDAWAAREPATIAVGSAVVPDASRNRALDAHLAGHEGAHDHVKRLARVLRIDAIDGRPLGAIVNFAAHGTIVGDGDLLFTGDNQGVAARLVARGIAAESAQDEHDVVVAYLNGAQGDVSPVGAGADFFERVEDAGRRQAGPVLQAWRDLAGRGTSEVALDARLKFLCFCGQEVEDGERISVVPILGVGDGNRMPAPLQVPGHGAKVPLLIGPGAVPQVVRLQALRVNDYVMVAMPGEASVALGERIERDVAAAHPGVTVDVVGLANDYVSYMSTLPEYDWQAYEGSFNLYGRMTGPLFRQELTMLADALLRGEPVVAGWAGVVEHPDTATPSAGQPSVAPGAPPAVLRDAWLADGAAWFAWLGGSPAVDHPVDAVMVRVVDVATGATLADDRGFEIRVRYEKEGADRHAWRAEVPVPPSWAGRDVRFEVQGLHVAVGGAVAPYALASGPLRV